MNSYYTETIIINYHQIPFTIKLISDFNHREKTIIHALALKENITNYLANNKYLPRVIITKRIFEKFLFPFINQNILVAVAINGGGNIQTGVAYNQDYIWNIAIENPTNVQNNIYTYHIQNGSIVTENIEATKSLNTKLPFLKQVTIVAEDLFEANNLAIKALHLGEQEFSKLAHEESIHGVLINQKNTLTVLE